MFFFYCLTDKPPAQNSTRRSASVASYAACRGGLTIDDVSQTIAVIITFIKSNKTQQSVGAALSVKYEKKHLIDRVWLNPSDCSSVVGELNDYGADEW